MFYNNFIDYITNGKYSTFKDFEKAANDKEIFFKTLNNEFIIYTNDSTHQNTTCYNFFSAINPAVRTMYGSNFNLREFLQKEYKIFIEDYFFKTAKKYNLEIVYNSNVSINENVKALFNQANQYILHESDFEFFSYFLD